MNDIDLAIGCVNAEYPYDVRVEGYVHTEDGKTLNELVLRINDGHCNIQFCNGVPFSLEFACDVDSRTINAVEKWVNINNGKSITAPPVSSGSRIVYMQPGILIYSRESIYMLRTFVGEDIEGYLRKFLDFYSTITKG